MDHLLYLSGDGPFLLVSGIEDSVECLAGGTNVLKLNQKLRSVYMVQAAKEKNHCLDFLMVVAMATLFLAMTITKLRRCLIRDKG